ncbi:TATA box-binding protein-like 1 isoform X1 [Gigantopelta aegis]|uniref:TATA box-binding protein-like 1 isoform X1 n=1 Tax=Gigantopelta aegis TaxID=1735272 RepID=UPI001B88C3AF|nr:TATA box-binding protein-like 1 isoform X1 [Gigantopelta aegis]XP_041357933.1 TATA box-binding protein-like 1 isoform X1 [Gigantopelta aegis]
MATEALCSSLIDKVVHETAVNESNKENVISGAFDSTASGEAEAAEPVIDIVINNVVCTFTTRCHLNLKQIALAGANVEYRREQGMLNMKIRRPQATASIWSSGKITCTGSTSEDDAHRAARRFARRLQRMGYNVRFSNFRVVNVLGTCSMPFGIKITLFSKEHKNSASYEPELHPGVTYRIKEPKATLKIFSTGSITVTAPSVGNVQSAIEHIYPLVSEFKAEKRQIPASTLLAEKRFRHKSPKDLIHRPTHPALLVDSDEEELYSDSCEDESFDSEESQD